jgi:hypothetical protein
VQQQAKPPYDDLQTFTSEEQLLQALVQLAALLHAMPRPPSLHLQLSLPEMDSRISTAERFLEHLAGSSVPVYYQVF